MQVNERPETIGFKAGQSKDGGLGDEREVSPTLSHKPSALEPTLAQSGVQCLTPSHPQMHRVYSERGAFPSLCHNGGEAGQNQQAVLASLSQMRYIVRRLTPTEAERLMGLPDGWTIPTGLRRYFGADGEPSPELVDEFVERFDTFNAIMAAYEHKAPPKGKSHKQVADWLKKISDAETCPDSPRYKGCGNSWASNQPRWILTRLLAIGEGIGPFTGEELDEKKIELIGHRYNRLVVIGYAPDYVSPRGKHWTNCICKCDCGATHIARACSLRSGAVKSCGCLSREQAAARQRKHGLAHKDPLYTVWKGMRERCNNPNQTKNSPYYWSRGIRVCAEWDDFIAFRTWALSHGWQRGLQIDRIDPDKGYSPDNCRIATPSENRRNCRPRRRVA